ncbi:hypothetical protein SAMN04324257_01883 [Thermoanaerobacter thermohydrosulfuricus]|nr:hypothetical protein SAMN04324257_01883 [Thermoanaerobacter thermohydrosulfuricus]
MNIITYHEFRKISLEKAKEVVRKIFKRNNCNILKPQKYLVFQGILSIVLSMVIFTIYLENLKILLEKLLLN